MRTWSYLLRSRDSAIGHVRALARWVDLAAKAGDGTAAVGRQWTLVHLRALRSSESERTAVSAERSGSGRAELAGPGVSFLRQEGRSGARVRLIAYVEAVDE